jgi:hypothetical protein
VPLHASATDCPLLKFGIFTIGHGHLLALTILIGPDRSTTIRLPLVSISAPYPVAARLVVGPDDFRDVGAGNERYDALALSGNGVGSEIDGGHYKSSSGPRFRLRARGPESPQRCRPFVLQGAYTTIRMLVLAGGCGFAGCPSDRTPGRHFTKPSV